MTMIACHECNREISDQAVQCPHCGVRIKAKSENSNMVHITVSTIISILGIMIAASGISKAGWILLIVGFIWFIGARITSQYN